MRQTDRYGFRFRPWASLLIALCLHSIGGLLADAEDHELRRLHWRDADQTNQPAVVDVVLAHGRAVALHEERLVRRRAEERTVAPHGREKSGQAPSHGRPGAFVVRLEHDPLRAALDRGLDKNEETADVDILPLRVG